MPGKGGEGERRGSALVLGCGGEGADRLWQLTGVVGCETLTEDSGMWMSDKRVFEGSEGEVARVGSILEQSNQHPHLHCPRKVVQRSVWSAAPLHRREVSVLLVRSECIEVRLDVRRRFKPNRLLMQGLSRGTVRDGIYSNRVGVVRC